MSSRCYTAGGASALVDGEVGLVVAPRGRLALVWRPTIEGGRIAEIEAIADPDSLRALAVAVLDA